MLVVAVGLTDLGLTLARSSSAPSSSPAAHPSKALRQSYRPSHGRAHRLRLKPAQHARRHHPTTTTSAPAPGGPRLFSITPRHGRPGTTVIVHGANFISSDGVVLARVDGQATRTDCPLRTECYVTIPDLGSRHRRVLVAITTSAGTSNALRFHYR